MKKFSSKSKKRPYKQGIFRPIHPTKYKGVHPIIYRSGLEMQFMRFLDSNTNILEWGSESIVIPYQKPHRDGKIKTHRYYVDFNTVVKTPKGIKKFIVEVKPFRQISSPNPNRFRNNINLLREQNMYAVNQAKWKAATAWAKQNGYEFKIITEKDLPKS